MGAWDVSVFGNDDAADFGCEFDDANTAAEVASVIEGPWTRFWGHPVRWTARTGPPVWRPPHWWLPGMNQRCFRMMKTTRPSPGHEARIPCPNTLLPRPRQCLTA